MIKKHALLLVITLTYLAVKAQEIHFNTTEFRLTIDASGFVVSLYDKSRQKEYIPLDLTAPLLTIRANGQYINPTGVAQNGNRLKLSFGKNGTADIQAEAKADYIRFELKTMEYPEEIELVVWGPFPTTIHESIGESVGVVKDQHFAVGIQALNVKTLG